MDAMEKLETAIKMIEEARGVPLSASAVIHRGEMATVLEALKKSLPKTIAQAEKILQDQSQIIEEGRASAEQLISMAREEVAQMAWKASSNTVNNYNITINGENKGATDIVDELQYRTKISEAGVQ